VETPGAGATALRSVDTSLSSSIKADVLTSYHAEWMLKWMMGLWRCHLWITPRLEVYSCEESFLGGAGFHMTEKIWVVLWDCAV